MRCLRLSLTWLAFLFLAGGSWLFAFDDWLPITPEDQKITAESEKGVDAVVLYHEETADDKTHHLYVYKRVKILTDKGKDQADVHIPFDGTFTGISEIRGRTVSPDGSITPFTGKAFNTTVVKGHGLKYQAKAFTLPNVQVGSIIEWKYTEYWDAFLFAPHWTVQDELPQKRAKFVFIPFTTQAYGAYISDRRGGELDRVYYSLIGLPQSTAIKTVGQGRMELELHDIPAYQPEEFSPPPAVSQMRVNFYYGDSKMGKPQEFWKQEGKYWSKDTEEFIGRPALFATTLTQILGSADSPDQKLRKIYSFVQQIKNLNYENPAAEQLEELLEERKEFLDATSKEKRSAETVLRKREGRRDELTRVFVGLARAAGIQAYVMRVADRDEVFFQQNVPNPSQLTSEIAIVVVDGKEQFLDPGTRFCPYGLLSWQHTSTEGIRQSAGGGTQIASTPPANYRDAVSKRVGRLSLADDASARGQIAIAWTGVEALDHRLSGFKTDEAGRKKELEQELKGMLPPGSTVELLQASGWDNPDAQLTATFKVYVPSFGSLTGKRLLVPSYLFQATKMQLFAHGERKQPVYFNYPYYSIDDVQITFPAGFRAESVPQTQPVRTDFSLYKVQRSVNGNTFSMTRDFAVAGIAFLQQDYPQLKKFFDGVNTGDSESLVLAAGQ